ncbi:MAG: cyclic nucleotide-binding domain-containing protein [Chloroflexi bacterium]|nr:cyclic nucleotide-binding domain-containing protein [Chloroflexota bacterium]
MYVGELGMIYRKGEKIVRQGETGDCMYVIQAGKVEVVLERSGGEIPLAVLESGDIFGEMALFSRATRSATARALTEARVLTIDKRGFLRRVHEDPSLAFRILQKMSDRIRNLNSEVAKLKEQQGSGQPETAQGSR